MFTKEKLDEVLRATYAAPRPSVILVHPLPHAAVRAEMVAIEWQRAGANWRRVKRERRKAFDRFKAEIRRR